MRMIRDRVVRSVGGRAVSVGLLAVLALGPLAGCSGYTTFRQAQLAEQRGDWDQVVLRYIELTEKDPQNIEYRASLLRAKIKASQGHFETGKRFAAAGVAERALIEYQQAAQLDPSNQYAQVELEKVRGELRAAAEQRERSPTLDEMKKASKGARAQPPVLDPRSKEPISLDFPKPVSVFDIYRALGKAFGINVLFDPNLKDQQIAIQLQDVTAQDALEFLMRAAGHFYKVVDEHSVLVAADTPQNRRNYEDLIIQTFFLSNAEVKDVMTILRSLIGAKNIASDESLNAVTIRDTADKVKVAERIIDAIDKSKSEVVVDVELLQINTGKLRDLGMSLSSYQITQSLDVGGEDVPLRLSDLQYLNQSNWILNIPNFLYSFVKNSSEAQLLARPQLRISEGEKASLVIGDRVPIPVTTFNSSQTIGGTIVPITSFQYQEVGIKIELEPRVHHNKEVSLKIKVEVSNLAGSVGGAGGQSQPIIGTRTIDTSIRLKDGETNFLAGLIRSDELNADEGIPGLSEIPIIGRLFSKNRTENTRTDVVLTLTPHIVRLPDITQEDLMPIWVGTEANITFRSGSPRIESDVEGPFEEGEVRPEDARDVMRERIQRLPRGESPLGGDPTLGQPPQPAPGIDLVPPAFPEDIFRKEPDEGESKEPPPVEPDDG